MKTPKISYYLELHNVFKWQAVENPTSFFIVNDNSLPALSKALNGAAYTLFLGWPSNEA